MSPFLPGAYPALRLRSMLWLCALFAAAATAQQHHDDHDHGDEFEQHGVHEHGKVTFNVALDGRQLLVELDAPASPGDRPARLRARRCPAEVSTGSDWPMRRGFAPAIV